MALLSADEGMGEMRRSVESEKRDGGVLVLEAQWDNT